MRCDYARSKRERSKNIELDIPHRRPMPMRIYQMKSNSILPHQSAPPWGTGWCKTEANRSSGITWESKCASHFPFAMKFVKERVGFTVVLRNNALFSIQLSYQKWHEPFWISLTIDGSTCLRIFSIRRHAPEAYRLRSMTWVEISTIFSPHKTGPERRSSSKLLPQFAWKCRINIS